jgi:hypothetical protein
MSNKLVLYMGHFQNMSTFQLSKFSGIYWHKTTKFFLADEHIYNLLVRKKSKFDENLFWILRNRSWDMSQIVKMAYYFAENMHLTLIIKVLDIIQQCKIHLIMLNIAQKHLIILNIAIS